jgi:uncharacterized protein YrrD
MFKGRDMIGKAIVSYDAGEKFDLVKDLVFDQESNQLLGFLVQEAGWFRRAQILLLRDVQAIGGDAVITSSQGAIANAHKLPDVGPILDQNTILKGTRILTLDGRDLGVIVDLYFDETNGKVEGYEVSGGLFADAYSGRSFVPAVATLKIGRDVAFVPTQTAQLMEEQVGGFRGAMQTASDRLQEGAQVTGDRLQELGQSASAQLQEAAQITGDTLQEIGQTASERIQATAQVTGESLHELGQSANDRLNQTAQLTNERLQHLGHYANEAAQDLAQPLHGLGRTPSMAMTNALLDPKAQKVFVIGKVSDREVITPTGSLLVLQGQHITHETADAAEALGILDDLYRAVGGSWAVPLEARLTAAVARVTVEQAEGRRSQHLVRNEAGSILVAPGQIVTPAVIERAKFYHREELLLQAVGLTAGAALQRRVSSAAAVAGDHLQNTSISFGNQLQTEVRGLWHQVSQTANDLRQRSARALEAKHIQSALGRPVTRVILGQQDQVILNVGELITHQAIAHARQAQVLDLLLNSVYTSSPQLFLEDLRAYRIISAL